jgi:hypothetical protein
MKAYMGKDDKVRAGWDENAKRLLLSAEGAKMAPVLVNCSSNI